MEEEEKKKWMKRKRSRKSSRRGQTWRNWKYCRGGWSGRKERWRKWAGEEGRGDGGLGMGKMNGGDEE